jgi:TctA family transporter
MKTVISILAAWVVSTYLYFTILGVFDVSLATVALLCFIAVGIAAWVVDDRRAQ